MAGAVEIPAVAEAIKFMAMTPKTELSLIGVGFVGGLLSGFLGSGGAFIMTPAMMSLGVPGIMAVAANITHKFGKAIIGSKKHGEFGNVDKKMGLIMCIALFAGVQLAVVISKNVLHKMGAAGSDLYISAVFVVILTWVTLFMYRDIARSRKNGGKATESGGLAEKIKNMNIPPMIHFKVANVTTSLWLALLVALATGFLAGSIGVGGFVGVPAMIYLLGVPTYVAAGTELFLAIFSGAQGAFLYSLYGYVDLRITLFLYIGSLIGVMLGAVGTRVVRGSQIKVVMVVVIALVGVSRLVMMPKYLADLGFLAISKSAVEMIVAASNVFLFGSGIIGSAIIITWIVQALRRAKVCDEKESFATAAH